MTKSKPILSFLYFVMCANFISVIWYLIALFASIFIVINNVEHFYIFLGHPCCLLWGNYFYLFSPLFIISFNHYCLHHSCSQYICFYNYIFHFAFFNYIFQHQSHYQCKISSTIITCKPVHWQAQSNLLYFACILLCGNEIIFKNLQQEKHLWLFMKNWIYKGVIKSLLKV